LDFFCFKLFIGGIFPQAAQVGVEEISKFYFTKDVKLQYFSKI